MSKEDLHLVDQEEQYQEARAKVICYDAAILIVQGSSRPAAIQKAKETYRLQEEAEADPTGALGTLQEAQSPILTPGTEAQVAAIALELYQQYGSSL